VLEGAEPGFQRKTVIGIMIILIIIIIVHNNKKEAVFLETLGNFLYIQLNI
jgi:hypothetical protein